VGLVGLGGRHSLTGKSIGLVNEIDQARLFEVGAGG